MKKEPLRMCIICRQSKPKKELIRIVKNKENEIKLDKTYKLQGRGTYICKDEACVSKAEKQRRIEKVFEVKEVDDTVYESIRGVLGEIE